MYCNALKVLKERGFVEWSSHNEELEEHFYEKHGDRVHRF